MPPATDDTTAARRKAAALAGHHGDEVAARRALADEAPAVRATALGALARIGNLRPDDIQAALVDPAATVRARAAECAVSVGGDAVVPGVADLLGDPDPSVVEAACFALGELGAIAAVRALAGVAERHTDALCREAAVAALGAIGDEAGLPAILSATSDKPAVRRRAVLALAPFSGPEVEAALQRALADRDWQVRQAAEDLTNRTT